MERSLYFKGLMLLIRKDQVVGEGERALMMRIGRLFSFEKEFCQKVIDEIMTNRHVVDEPPLFSEPGKKINFGGEMGVLWVEAQGAELGESRL